MPSTIHRIKQVKFKTYRGTSMGYLSPIGSSFASVKRMADLPMTLASLCLLLSACGGDSPPTSSTSASTPPITSYTIGGTITGLATSESMTLLDNGGDTLTLAANGAFTFATPVAPNQAYAVTINTSPMWQNCVITNDNGVATAKVTQVKVTCAAASAQVSTLAGQPRTAGSTNGSGTGVLFDFPSGVAVDASGNVYVADSFSNEIRQITSGVVSTLAGSPGPGAALDGTGSSASFYDPTGVAVDVSGNVYVADHGNNEIRIVTPLGVVSTLAGSTTGGAADGTGALARFAGPSAVAVDVSGNVYVADHGNNEIRIVTPAGVVSTLARSFNGPEGVAVDASGNVYVADSGNNEIRKITPTGVVSTLAGSTTSGSADGTGSGASFDYPAGVAVDASGNVYVADYGNNEIRKITPLGVVTTLAGSTTPGDVDGTGSAAAFDGPYGVAVDASGNVYVAEYDGQEIREITPGP
ncbi:NHL repeat-containing protein [Pararobbsia silviterrae]|nr:NHL repeat-containing protein [Pararobbsia silviterrae]